MAVQMRTMHPLTLKPMMRPHLRRRSPSLPRTALIRRHVPPCLLNSPLISNLSPPRTELHSANTISLRSAHEEKTYSER